MDNFALQAGYDLSTPDEKYLLPGALEEISGLSYLKNNVLASVQDELGTIFLYDLKQKTISDRMKFGKTGDYEGIEVVDDQVYVITSNGKLHRYSLKDQTSVILDTPLKASNNVEGLGYDHVQKRLLIACKGDAGIGKKSISGKAVYSNSLSTGFDKVPALLIEGKELEAWSKQQVTPLKITNKIKGFKPSGIAVHPKTKDIFIVASVGKVLLVVSPQGNIRHCVPLPPKLFKQPEGICFAPNGDLYISNEGNGGRANILEFKARK